MPTSFEPQFIREKAARTYFVLDFIKPLIVIYHNKTREQHFGINYFCIVKTQREKIIPNGSVCYIDFIKRVGWVIMQVFTDNNLPTNDMHIPVLQNVSNDVPMGEHDTLWAARSARRINEHSYITCRIYCDVLKMRCVLSQEVTVGHVTSR